MAVLLFTVVTSWLSHCSPWLLAASCRCLTLDGKSVSDRGLVSQCGVYRINILRCGQNQSVICLYSLDYCAKNQLFYSSFVALLSLCDVAVLGRTAHEFAVVCLVSLRSVVPRSYANGRNSWRALSLTVFPVRVAIAMVTPNAW